MWLLRGLRDLLREEQQKKVAVRRYKPNGELELVRISSPSTEIFPPDENGIVVFKLHIIIPENMGIDSIGGYANTSYSGYMGLGSIGGYVCTETFSKKYEEIAQRNKDLLSAMPLEKFNRKYGHDLLLIE